MTECHVQLVHNALIWIQTLNLRITSTRNPVAPLTLLNCKKPHSQGENVLIRTQRQENYKHTFHNRIKGFIKVVQI